ncbi:MAG: HAMP domain-containing sensor histidine kinase [Rhodobacteraceae bacterium]|jgi:signal transduction histidine kinase|nr:HAMP domain-containing sensor histidine kinase [Paracoccaceae bacterium]MCZ8084160.1 HAMP domain-containing sensor histidine kinase [Paracoccaceae bacterium]
MTSAPYTAAPATPRNQRLSAAMRVRRYLRSALRMETSATRLEKQVRDYVNGSLELFWKRQTIYAAAALLCGFYYNLQVAVLCYLFIQFTEFCDTWLSLRIVKWQGGSLREARRYRDLLLLSAVQSTTAIVLWAAIVAYMEGISSHFMPLFFLFAAGLFAAVNNHQIPQILLLRLVMYAAVFLYIPIADLLQVMPPIQSFLWLQLFTVVFVLFFVIECSIIFLRLYRRGLDQLDELRLERDRVQAAYEVKSQFVSVVSHELRTPLTSINGALGLLRTGAYDNDPAKARNILEIAHKNSIRLSALINDLLDLQKIESGQMSYNFDEIDLASIVEECIGSMETFAQTYGITFDFTPPEEMVIVHADRDRLHQVLDNLMSNAVKFSRRGETVILRILTKADRILVEVEDHGVGIPPDSREKVFGRFTQVDSSDRRSHGGTGLGLNIAQEIMAAHGGTVTYTSKLGEGSTFVIDFPMKD